VTDLCFAKDQSQTEYKASIAEGITRIIRSAVPLATIANRAMPRGFVFSLGCTSFTPAYRPGAKRYDEHRHSLKIELSRRRGDPKPRFARYPGGCQKLFRTAVRFREDDGFTGGARRGCFWQAGDSRVFRGPSDRAVRRGSVGVLSRSSVGRVGPWAIPAVQGVTIMLRGYAPAEQPALASVVRDVLLVFASRSERYLHRSTCRQCQRRPTNRFIPPATTPAGPRHPAWR
jgi:hypothetical protein